MGKGNGKSEESNLDLEHELPAAEGEEETAASAGRGSADSAAAGAVSEVEQLKAERDALLDRLARLQAEFDNARKRAAREQQEFREFAAAEVIKGLLPALDSFERALKTSQHAAPLKPKAGLSGPPSDSSEAGEFRSGIELIYRQFQDALQKAGVQPVVSVGQPFDPRVHEAIEMVDTTEVPDHHVMDELQRGYKFKDRLLRPAMVRVARNSGG
jgi:molecular chaperone GrpE